MNNDIQLHSIGTLRALRGTLDNFDPSDAINTAFLVSFEHLPVNLSDKRESENLIFEFTAFCERHKTSVYQISNTEFVFLAQTTSDNDLSMKDDLRILMLGLIQNLYPGFFNEIDQTRIVRKIPLPDKLENLRSYIANRHIEAVSNPSGSTGKNKLKESDISTLEAVFSKKEPKAIAHGYISRQSIFLTKDDEPIKPVAEEFFISMDAIRSSVLKDADFRGNAALFNHMTLSLDKILLRSLHHVPNRNLPISINLNVESVFTTEFKNFMQIMGNKNLERIQIEFRQADVLQHLRKYNLIGRTLLNHKGSTVIDAVFPETLGLLRMERLSPSFVKIFWQNDGDVDLKDKKADIADIVKAGIFPVLARVDSEEGYKVGRQLGIKLFQGFYFDNLNGE